MMKSSSLLLLGVTCLFLLHLVQEGQGLRCYAGAGNVKFGMIEHKRDCQGEKEEDLHSSCKENEGAERDYCVTSTLTLSGPPSYAKWCGCSKGLDSGELTPQCYDRPTIKICACNTDLCNNILSATDPAPGPPPSPNPEDHDGETHSDATFPVPVPALFLLMTFALAATPFSWILY